MAEIYVPGAIDIMGSANQMMQFRNSQQAQQENAMRMQFEIEDRARAEQARKVAAGNALAEQARKRELLNIYSNFGVTPAVTGQRGQAYSGTGVANNPYAAIQNELLRKGFTSQAGDIAELQNKTLTGEKTMAEIAGTQATNIGIDYSNTANFIKMTNAQIDAAPDIASLKAIVAATFTPGHPMAKFNELNGLTIEQSMAAIDGLIAQGKTFEQIREQMSQGASKAADNIAARGLVAAQTESAKATTDKTVAETKAADEKRTAPLPTEMDIGGKKIIVDMNPNSPTFKQVLTSIDKTLTLAEELTKVTDAEKRAWERANPGFTIEDTAQGKVRVNKVTGEVTPLTLGGETLMPTDNRTVTNIYEPATETALKKYLEDVSITRKELRATTVVLDNIEKAKELIPEASNFMGAGGDAYLTAAKFLNNRFGSNIDVEGVKSAEELRSRLFMGVLDNLKKLDSQPTQQQQQALQEAFGRLETDPNALPQVLDVIGDVLRTKVDLYNKDVTDAEARGVKFPFKPQIDLPPQKIIRENSFPNADAAGQILKQRGAKPGDRVRVNIGGQTGTFVVE